MKIEYLEYLVDFAETRSVSATAGHFYLSTQGMSRALHQLEKESGHILFENGGGYLKFTRAGMRFVDQARRIVGDYHDLQKTMRAFSSDTASATKPPVRVVATPAAARYLIPFLNLQAPGTFPFEVSLREENLGTCIATLKAAQPDRTLCLVSLPATDKFLGLLNETSSSGPLAFEPLAKSSVIALVSSSSALSQKKEFDTAKDLAGGIKCGYLLDEMLLDFIDDYVRDDDMRTVTSNLSLLEDQIANNQIISFMAKMYFATKKVPEGITVLPCKGTPEVMFGLLATRKAFANEDIAHLGSTIRGMLQMKEGNERFKGLYTCIHP